MSRPSRAFRSDPLELEGRRLLSGTTSWRQASRRESVAFGGPTIMGQPEYVLQSDRELTVSVIRWIPVGPGKQPAPTPLQVVVETDPASPAVGVNVGAVRQTLTFDPQNPTLPVVIPILSGAPNPGEVEVAVTLTVIDPPPGLNVGEPLRLRILASEDYLPPRVVGTQGTPRGLRLTFSKPMDPTEVANPKNYAVASYDPGHHIDTGWYSPRNFLGMDGTGPSVRPVTLRSAEYDPDTRTVTLVPRGKVNYRSGSVSIRLSRRAVTSGRLVRGAAPETRLVDLHGTPMRGGWTYPVSRSFGNYGAGDGVRPFELSTPSAATPPPALASVARPTQAGTSSAASSGASMYS